MSRSFLRSLRALAAPLAAAVLAGCAGASTPFQWLGSADGAFYSKLNACQTGQGSCFEHDPEFDQKKDICKRFEDGVACLPTTASSATRNGVKETYASTYATFIAKNWVCALTADFTIVGGKPVFKPRVPTQIGLYPKANNRTTREGARFPYIEGWEAYAASKSPDVFREVCQRFLKDNPLGAK